MRMRNLLTQSSSTLTAKYNLKRNNQSISKISKYLTYPYVYFLILATCLDGSRAATVGDFLPVGAQLRLPQGFRPQTAPSRPMLLPFVTPAPNSPSGGWKPIVGSITKPAHSTRLPSATPRVVPPPQHPALEDCTDTMRGQISAQQEEGPVLESVVYGAWKPGRPLRPEEMQASTTRSSHPEVLKTTVKKSEPANYKIEPASSETQSGDPRFIRKTVSRRISTTQTQKTTLPSLKSINPHLTTPKLLKMFQQNRSSLNVRKTSPQPSKNPNVHKTTTLRTESETETETKIETETEIITTTEPMPIDVKKVWPTDFSPKNLNYSSEEDFSYQLNKFNASTIADNLLPQIPLNITKVGVPYEELDSAEEPKMCVPITVIDELSRMEIERVYCFPLPSPHTTEVSNSKGVVTNVVDYTVYGVENAGEMLSTSFIRNLYLTLMILYWLRDIYALK